MSVRLGDGGMILLEGECVLEEAEVLLGHLLTLPQAAVDWRACEAAHTAVVQVLLASSAPVQGPPRGEFLRHRVEPLLAARRIGARPLPGGPGMA